VADRQDSFAPVLSRSVDAPSSLFAANADIRCSAEGPIDGLEALTIAGNGSKPARSNAQNNLIFRAPSFSPHRPWADTPSPAICGMQTARYHY
jgi:hypothetical protein